MDKLQKISWTTWTILAVILSIAAFFIHLGMNPYIEDEAIRATVALEMQYSGNFITPTINGEYYYSKPPLYNWILLIFATIIGGLSEWSTRVPTVFFLAVFCYLIYRSHIKGGFQKREAVLASLFYLTCGRIIFWDSFLGLIDICFSMVMYVMMVNMYFHIREKNFNKFYLSSYFLASIGFLLKGYPALVFLAITILLCIWLYGKWKDLIQLSHLGGILILVMIIGGYYFTYSQYHAIESTVSPLLDQATRRTFVRYGWWPVVLHIFTYPFENIYHFLPWTVLVILLFKKGFLTQLKGNDFVYFSALCFVANIIVYWISPEVFPRYILMLVPMAFTVFIYFLKNEIEIPTWRYKLVHILFKLLVVVLPVLLVIGLFNEDIRIIPYWTIKGVIILLMMSVTAIFYWKAPQHQMFIMVLMVLLLRIAFDLFVFPIRTDQNIATYTKAEAIRIAKTYGEQGISLYENTEIDYTSTFYMERKLGYILGRRSETPYEIIDAEELEIPQGYIPVDSFLIRRDENILTVLRKE